MTETPGSGSGTPPDPNFPPPAAYQPPPANQPPAYQPPAYQPPPVAPPAGPPGQPGQFGFDPKSLQGFDPKTVNPLDWGIIGAGFFTLIFSFFGYYKYSVKIDGFGSSSGTVSAWHGFFGWFAALVALAAAAILAADVIAKVKLPFPVRLTVLGGFALALLCAILALVVVPGNTGSVSSIGIHVNKGHGFAYWISLILLLVGTGLAFVRFTASGGKLVLPGRH
jgi:hypothetical protein